MKGFGILKSLSKLHPATNIAANVIETIADITKESVDDIAEALAHDPGEETYQDRVIEEKEELDEKFEKLTDFLQSDVFLKLDAANRDLMIAQHHHMFCYSSILKTRIDGFGKPA